MKKNKGGPEKPWLPDLPKGLKLPAERPVIDIFRHEAGHMVLALVLGFETSGMKFERASAGAEINPKPTFSDLAQISAYLEMRMTVLYSGVLAESLKDGKVQNDVAIKLANGIEGSDDHSKVSEFARIVAGIECDERSFDEVWKETESKVWKRAADLVEKYATQIVALSKEWRALIGGAETYKVTEEQMKDIACFRELKPGCEGVLPTRITDPAETPKTAEKPQSD
jgi:hypothetical protein